jgi:IclR family acetate operon transcriptional repressor
MTWPSATDSDDGQQPVRSVQRALRMIEIVADGPRDGMSLTAIAERLGTSKSTALASARTLAAEGFLRALKPGPRYKLGTALIRYGDLASKQSPIAEVCLPLVREVSEATGMTARLAVSEEGYPVCVARVDGPGAIRFYAPLGRREPPHATAAGKAVLAMQSLKRVLEICQESGLKSYTVRTITEISSLLEDLVGVRRCGYSIDDEEEEAGIFCVGAPFFDHEGNCAGVISVTGIKQDLPSWRMSETGALLRRFADNASELLGGPSFALLAPSVGVPTGSRDTDVGDIIRPSVIASMSQIGPEQLAQ